MGKIGLLGEHLVHSMSPQIHAQLGDYPYAMHEVSPDALPAFMQAADFDGLNVTIPYKKAVMPYCAKLSKAAEQIGSVNTIVKQPDGSLWGYNTDYYGFLYTLQHHGVAVLGKKAVVLGSGGASLAVQAVLKDLNAREVVVVSRSGENNYQNLHLHYDADILVNATPVGMYPHNAGQPVDLQPFTHLAFVGDLIYNPIYTNLLQQAKALGIAHANGLMMLAAQAKKANELFFGQSRTDEDVARAVSATQKALQNIVFVGMPGCGKTTLGTALAARLGLPFLDSDVEIEKREKQPIPRIIEEQGESAFRDKESAMLCELSAKNGMVLATGGGAILRPENRQALWQNGLVLFLNRNIDSLATKGRPLSKGGSALQELYRARLPLYKEVCHFEIDANGTAEEVLERILEVLK